MRRLLPQLLNQEDGQDLVEYACLVGLLALVAFVGVHTLGQTINAHHGTTINGSAPFAS